MNKQQLLRFVVKSILHRSLEVFGRTARSRAKSSGTLIIITYHSFSPNWPTGLVSSLPVKRFGKHLEFLKEKFEVVPLEDGIEAVKNKKSISKPYLAITIDDGFLDNYILGFELLKAHKVPATIFLATDFIENGRVPWPTQILELLERTRKKELSFPINGSLETVAHKKLMAKKLKSWLGQKEPQVRFDILRELKSQLGVFEKETSYKSLSWKHVEEMHSWGVTFGSHTHFHSMLSNMEESIVHQELLDSKNHIEARLNNPCKLFCFPDGNYNEQVVQIVQDCGYRYAVTQDPGFNKSALSDYTLKRIEIPFHDPHSTFRCRVSLSLL